MRAGAVFRVRRRSHGARRPRPSGGGVTGGEEDLDGGAEEARARHGVLGLAEDAADHRVGDVDPALGEPQQREAGLWVPAELVGALIRGFGAFEVADEAEEITLDHARAAERRQG